MKFLERAFPWLLLAPAILPLVVWGGLIYPYLVPKTLLFYTISLLALGVFVILAAHKRPFQWSRVAHWEAWAPLALLMLAYVASYVGIDFYRSFWSLLVRGDGLLMLTGVVASFYLILLSADRKFFDRLVRVVAAVASVVAVFGIGEWLTSGGRIGGLLGNAAFFAGYLGISFFATLLAALTLSGRWKKAAYVSAALQVVAIVLSATRGTILALAVAFVAALAFRVFKGKKKVCRVQSASALIVVALVASSFFVFRSQLAHVPFEPVARIATISNSETDVASRLFIWKNVVMQIKQSPWLGVGTEHIDVLFNRFYDPTQIIEQWFDRSHNAFFDYAAQYGFGGLALYLIIIGSFFVVAVREARRGAVPRALLLGLLALTYAVQNFFVFDTISSLWLFIALLAAALAHSTDDKPETLSFAVWVRPASYAFVFLLICLVWSLVFKPALAAYDLAHAYAYQLVDPERSVSYLSHGMALGTYADVEYGYEAYLMYTQVQMNQLSGQERIDAYRATVAILKSDFERYPYDARTADEYAHLLTIDPTGASIDGVRLSDALNRAITLSPKRAQAWYLLANLSISNANAYPIGTKGRAEGYTAAKDILGKYIALVPALAEPHFVLAQLEYAIGEKSAAAAAAAAGRAAYTSNLETARRAAVYYENALDLPNAAFFLGEVVRLDPSDTAAASDLAKIKAYEQSKQ